MGAAATHGEGPERPPGVEAHPALRAAPTADVKPHEGSAGDDGTVDLSAALSVLRARIDEEFRITERLDTKMRQAFALAAGFFAIAQTVAFGSFAATRVGPADRVVLGSCALVAALSLVVVAHRLVGGEETLEEEDIRPDAVVRWVEEATAADEVSLRILSQLSLVARRRTENNRIRQHNHARVQDGARWSLIATGVELGMAIVLRL